MNGGEVPRMLLDAYVLTPTRISPRGTVCQLRMHLEQEKEHVT